MHSVVPPELVADRQNWLLAELAEQRRVTTNAAADALGVSVDTIRRDLRALHDLGLLRRVHGGAVQLLPLSSSFSGRTADHSPERTLLANAIVQRLQPGQVIGLDGGTTTAQIASQIPQSLAVTIVTNNPAVAIALADHQSAAVILLGGEVDLNWMATNGVATVDELRTYQLDLAIVGVCSFDLDAGASTRSRHAVATKQAFMAAAAETIVPLESDKLGTIAPFRVAETGAVEIVVVKAAIEPAALEQWRAAGAYLTGV